MVEDLKSKSLLPANATRPEHALAATACLADQVEDPIGLMWDPWKVPTAALRHFAWQVRVPLWDSNWTETKQRSIAAQAPELNAMKGRVQAYKRYVEIMGGRVTQVRVPPDGIYLDGGWSDEERQTWLSRFAEVRVYDQPGADTIEWDFADEGFLDDHDDDGVGGFFLAPYEPKPKHRAVLIDGDTERELELIEVRSVDIFGTVHLVERLFERGFAEGGFYADEAYVEDYLDPPEPLLFLQIDNGIASSRPGFDAALVSNRPQHVTETGEADSFFADCNYVDDYLDVSVADRMIYDSFRLYDPLRSTGVPDGGFCLDDPTHFEIPPNTMLVDIDARHVVSEDAVFGGHSFFGDYLIPDDGAFRQRLLDAAAAANPTSDKTLVSTTLHRPIRFSDGLKFGEFKFGEFINETERRNA